MALNKNIKVAMPEHGCVKREMGDKVYVYYATAVYRNEKGQPTSDRTSIGRYDEETGMLIPNRSYYEVYLKQNAPIEGGVYSRGVSTVFNEICKKTGLAQILKRYFPERYKEILTVAQYMLSEGNVMSYIEDYTETHETALNEKYDDVSCSRLFSSIREEDTMLFLKDWLNKNKTDEYIAYDVTSISSYSKQIAELEWGYNRDKEKLPQINMGMYYGEETKLPLYYRIYPGSISDKAHLKYMVESSNRFKNNRLRYVMDRGFYSGDNLRFLTENGHRFVIALPGSLNYCKELVKKYRDTIINKSEYSLGLKLPYGKSVECDELGFRMNVHIYYDPQKALQESEALYELIEHQENDLKNMEEPPERNLHYDKYFYINRSKDGKLGFKKNHKAIDEALKMCGFFLIAETDFKKTTAQILNIYRTRDTVEKSFDNLKNELDFKRVHCQTSETLKGKIFVSFISLIVKSYMANLLGDFARENNYSTRKILLELDKIKTLKLSNTATPKQINPVSKLGRTVLDLLLINPDVCDTFV